MSTGLTDAFRTHPVHLHHNHLDFKSVRDLPDLHTWPEVCDYPSGEDIFEVESVPVINLTDPRALKRINHACQIWGVFQVTNHGIPMDLFEDIEKEGMRLFSLSVEQKLKAARSPNGISGYGLARISSFFSKLMWSEGFTIVGSPIKHARQLWPEEYQEFCKVFERYDKEMKKLSSRLMWLMLSSLRITREDLKWAGPKGELGSACAAMQLNSYPACPDPSRAMGLAAHTDSTLFTVLYKNSTRGLQVFRDGTGWVTVPPVRGALVVNVGDLLHILSNGQYTSVLHRAVVHHARHRLSIAYLYGPPMNVQISPTPKLIDIKHPPLYRSVTWSDYLSTKAKHFNKALLSIRLNRVV